MSGFSQRKSMVGAGLVFLILFWLRLSRPPVGDGGGENGNIGRQCRFDRRQHLARRFDMHDRHAGRIGQIDRTADQRHVGAGGRGRRRNGVALLARRAVGDVAHRIESVRWSART